MQKNQYTRTRGLRFIGDYDLKPPRQIFSIDSNISLPYDYDFLYQFFWSITTRK